jgi:hypothetical protein
MVITSEVLIKHLEENTKNYGRQAGVRRDVGDRGNQCFAATDFRNLA